VSDSSSLRDLIDPQLAAAIARGEAINKHFGPPPSDPAGLRRHTQQTRAWLQEGGPVLAESHEDRIPGPFRDIPVMVHRPRLDGALPVFVYFHGGGFRIGSHTSNDRQMREIAASWGGAVVNADYVHVPEHVFPDPVLEAAAVYRWLTANGSRWGIDGSRMACGGSSAGANVMLGGALESGVRLAAAVGIVGVFDRNLETTSMRRFGEAGVYPSRNGVRETMDSYVPDPALRADPRVEIVAADPALFPPLFLAAAELDTLCDSSRNLAARLSAAGPPCKLKVYPGMTHLFFNYSARVDRARECMADVAAFLSEMLPV
jgi:acetyl esterase